ncbi:unnamed protein product [Linum trigynum]|uniref:Uncharacterized protein n=1 Tax=Linum trigynum TaxID=586398 RepID=A0AAV2DNS6_9ROSI
MDVDRNGNWSLCLIPEVRSDNQTHPKAHNNLSFLITDLRAWLPEPKLKSSPMGLYLGMAMGRVGADSAYPLPYPM